MDGASRDGAIVLASRLRIKGFGRTAVRIRLRTTGGLDVRLRSAARIATNERPICDVVC